MKRRRIIVIGQLPPPLMGFSFITAQIVDVLRRDHDVRVHNIAAREGALGLAKHLSRLARMSRACFGLLWHATVHGRTCYIGCEGDLGLLYTIIVSITARFLGYETFLHHHSFGYIDRNKRLMRCLLAVCGRPTHLFLSAAMRVRFEAQYGPVASSRIISNAAFIPPIEASLVRPAGEQALAIGHLSHLSRDKGLYLFLDLLKELIEAGLDIRGVLAGPVRSEVDRRAIDAAVSTLAPRLDYRGPIYGDAKERFYTDVDIFVFPTQYANEAQPAVLFEALAAGCEILACDRGCIADQVTDGLVVAKEKPFVEQGRTWIASFLAGRAKERASRAAIREKYADFQSSSLSAVRSLFST